MDLPLNVDVHCTDGRYGRSTYLVINPVTEKITHVVVANPKIANSERMVPVGWIKESTPELILLNRTKNAVKTLEPFNQTDFVQREESVFASDPKLTLLWPYVAPAKMVVPGTIRKMPPGELAVRRGARVRATDGRIGQVDEFVVDPQSSDITHLVLREGLPWDKKLITIPVWEIDRIEENVVHLKLDKQSVRALPTIPLKQRP